MAKKKQKRTTDKDRAKWALERALDNLKEAVKSPTETEQLQELVGTTLNLSEYCEKSKQEEYAKKFKQYSKVFESVLKLRSKTHAHLHIFLDDKTKIKRTRYLSPEISEDYDLKRWKETCNITDKLDGTTEINFFGLQLVVPTKKVNYLEEVKSEEDKARHSSQA